MLLESDAFGPTATDFRPNESSTNQWLESKTLLERLEVAIQETVQVSGTLRAAAEHHFASGGKRFRGRLALATGLASGLTREEALPAAVAVELLHNASLVHDDLQDGDCDRRGHSSVWAAFGSDIAILLGDMLIANALAASAGGPLGTAGAATATMARSVGRLAEGQARDTEPTASTRWTPQSYEWIARRKTGELVALAVRLPLIHAGAARADLERASMAGELVGVGYQILDDLADLTPGKGREVGADLRRARMSSVLVHHLLECDPRAARTLHDTLGRSRSSPGACQDLRATLVDLVEGPAVPACLAQQRRCFDVALQEAECIDTEVASVLRAAASDIRRRTFRTVASARSEQRASALVPRTS